MLCRAFVKGMYIKFQFIIEGKATSILARTISSQRHIGQVIFYLFY